MSLRSLERLFKPHSVALIRCGETTPGPEAAILDNLLGGGFTGPIMEIPASVKAADLPSPAPDLLVFRAAHPSVPGMIREMGGRGARGAIVLAGPRHDEFPALLDADIAAAARAAGMRLLGPGCFGLLVPGLGLNASIASRPARPGQVAFVAQSASVCATVLDWVRPQEIGFSHFIGLGRAVDVDFGDVLDYLGSDPGTRAILLVIDAIRERRRFLSAARAAARNKPVLAIKIGLPTVRENESGSHAGSLARPDAVYDAVFRRAGMLRVDDLDDMFTALETLARARPLKGGDLTIIGNGRGIAVVAADELMRRGGRLATLSPAVVEGLRELRSGDPSPGGLIDLGSDADGERYARALEILLDDPAAGSLLVTHAPTSLAPATEVASAVLATIKPRRTTVLTCWAGQEEVAPARHLFRDAGLPSYDRPGAAVRAYMNLLNFRKNQEMLMETPPSVLGQIAPDLAAVRTVVANALAEPRFILGEPEAKGILAAYGIPTVATRTARNPAAAARIAREIDGPVALKILSPDISHKSEYGGVLLDLSGPFEVEKMAHQMNERVAAAFPEARLEGFTVQPMMRRPGATEIMIGVATDPVFGPVILFGHGGTGVEIINDWAIGLPPLNMSLAREMIQRTRVHHLLHGYHGHPAADIDAICLALMKVSQLVIDLPELFALDINPLFADAEGVIALDARMVVSPAPAGGGRLSIRPYPLELEETVTTSSGMRVLLRPIRPEDEPNHHVLVSRLSPEDVRFRFFTVVNELPHSEMARLTQIDYEREMAFIAVPADDPASETLGVVRAIADADNDTAEFAIVVRSDLKGGGLGHLLMEKLIAYCRARGTRRLLGEVLVENVTMLHFVESLGFHRLRFVEGGVVEVALELGETRPEGATA